MSEDFVFNKEKVTFREIVLRHLSKILEISTTEFRGGYDNTIQTGNMVKREYVPSTKACYIQAVESLSHVLLPHFDKEMDEDFDSYQDELNRIKPKNKITTDMERQIYQSGKLELSQKLFMSLNLLLKRADYLKSSIYSESDLDDEEIDESKIIDTDRGGK